MNWLLCYGEYCFLPLIVAFVIIWITIIYLSKPKRPRAVFKPLQHTPGLGNVPGGKVLAIKEV